MLVYQRVTARMDNIAVENRRPLRNGRQYQLKPYGPMGPQDSWVNL